MITGSGRWIPPSLPPIRSPEHEKESATTFAAGRSRRVELERTLTDPQRDEFEDMLRALTLERSQIKEAMGFALDNADAAGEVVEVLTESLTLKETPIPTKVARLMLVSDILHNSSAPVKNASAYRTKFEATLPDIMESFNDLYRSITGRITAEALKERVLKVLQVWADWFLFSDAYVNGLRATFLRSGNSGVVPFHSICGDAPEIENKTSSEDLPGGIKLNQDGALAMGKGAAMQELLDLPLPELERRCRHNGLSLCGGREMMVARLLNLEEAEKQRGYDRDDDTRYCQSHSSKYSRDDDYGNSTNSGRRETNHRMESFSSSKCNRHIEETIQGHGKVSGSLGPTLAIPQPDSREFSSKKGKTDPVLPVSKWAREDDASDEDKRKGSWGLGISYLSSGSENEGDGLQKTEAEVTVDTSTSTHQESSMNEEHRQKLRRLEVAVMEYRESLEERGTRNSEDIEKKVVVHRRRLQSEFGLLDSAEVSNKQASRKLKGRTSMERKGRHDDGHDSRKRHRSVSLSQSPQKKSSIKDREKDNDVDRDKERHRERDRSNETETGRERGREKSGSRDREDHDRERSREREKDRERRRKGK